MLMLKYWIFQLLKKKKYLLISGFVFGIIINHVFGFSVITNTVHIFCNDENNHLTVTKQTNVLKNILFLLIEIVMLDCSCITSVRFSQS